MLTMLFMQLKEIRLNLSAKVQFDNVLLQNLTTNPKALYRYVRQKSKVKTTVGPLEKPDGLLTDDDSEVVDVLNKFFQSVITQEDLHAVLDFTPKVSCYLGEICITMEEVHDKLSSLNPNKAPGPDGFHPCLLKNCANTLTRPLFLIYFQSLENGKIPREWKKANIMPIFKKGNEVKASNFRPISLTSSICKLLKSLIREKMM